MADDFGLRPAKRVVAIDRFQDVQGIGGQGKLREGMRIRRRITP
jgi:hypothetical protein